MKYEISQEQYVDFLNTLTRIQQNTRTQTDISETSITYIYVMCYQAIMNDRNSIRCDETLPASEPITFYCDYYGDGIGNEENDGFDFYFISNFSNLDGDTVSIAKYYGGNFDGCVNQISQFANLNGDTLHMEKYYGGNYDGYGTVFSLSDMSLPVSVTRFQLEEVSLQTVVKIEWQTASEVDNESWLILRKSENDTFITVKKVPARSTSAVASLYEYLDTDVIAGETYTYRLADVCLNGDVNYHEEKTITVSVPKSFQLFQNYPNPFNSSTTIVYALPVSAKVKIEVYSILGRKVADILEKYNKAGYHRIVWSGKNTRGAGISSGMYIYLIHAQGLNSDRKEGFHKAKRMIVIK